MRRSLLTLVGAAALPVAGAGLLFVDWKLAKRGAQLPETPPFEHDGRIGGNGPALRMVWLGDSGIAGAGATSADTSIPRQVARALGRPVEVRSVAVSGARLRDAVVDQLPKVAGLEPDVVVVSVGSNDVLYRTMPGPYRADREQLLDGLPDDALVMVLGACDMGAVRRIPQPLRATLGLWGRCLDRVTRSVAEARGVVFVDMRKATGPAMRRDPDGHYCIDYFHASDTGYRLWADVVVAALRPALADRRTAEAGAVADR